VLFTRADQLFRQLKAARLDNSIEAEMRRLTRIELLIIDDFALKAMDQIETADFYELIVERHHKTATIVTSNRDASEWIALMSDPLRTRHRRRVLPPPTTTPTHRRERRVRLTRTGEPMNIIMLLLWSLGRGNPVVPSRWQATAAIPRPNAAT
jgi:DNA replication protein DnaC